MKNIQIHLKLTQRIPCLSVRATPKSPKADGLACPEIDGYNDHKKSRERKMPLKDARFAG